MKPYNRARVDSEQMPRTEYYAPRVRDLMTKNPLALSETDTVKALTDLMKWRSIRHVPVVDTERRLIGLVTQRDFLTIAVSKLAHVPKWELDELYSGMMIRDIMGKKVTSVAPDSSLTEAARTMFSHKYGCLPVTDEGRLVGIITEADFVKAFMDWNALFKTT